MYSFLVNECVLGSISEFLKIYLKSKVVHYVIKQKESLDILPCKTGYGSKAVKSNGAFRWNYIRRDIKEYAKSIEGMFNWYLPLCTIT